MKSNLVLVIEVLRITKKLNYINNKGKILFATQGLHETPKNSDSIRSLIKKRDLWRYLRCNRMRRRLFIS